MLTVKVLRSKTAKAIINRAYEADKNASISSDGLAVRGYTINAIAKRVDDGWDISLDSSVFGLQTLMSLVNDVYEAIKAQRALATTGQKGLN